MDLPPVAAELLGPSVGAPHGPALLGLLAPGLGQVFVGHTVRGILWAGVPLVVVALFFVFAREPSMITVFGVIGVAGSSRTRAR